MAAQAVPLGRWWALWLQTSFMGQKIIRSSSAFVLPTCGPTHRGPRTAQDRGTHHYHFTLSPNGPGVLCAGMCWVHHTLPHVRTRDDHRVQRPRRDRPECFEDRHTHFFSASKPPPPPAPGNRQNSPLSHGLGPRHCSEGAWRARGARGSLRGGTVKGTCAGDSGVRTECLDNAADHPPRGRAGSLQMPVVTFVRCPRSGQCRHQHTGHWDPGRLRGPTGYPGVCLVHTCSLLRLQRFCRLHPQNFIRGSQLFDCCLLASRFQPQLPNLQPLRQGRGALDWC